MKALSIGIYLAGLFCTVATSAQEPEFSDRASGSLASGFGYTSGKYGTSTTTTIESIPVTGSLSLGDFTFDATVPYLKVNGDPNVIPGLGTVGNTNPRKRAAGAAKGTGSGLGDAVLSVSYDFYMDPAAGLGFDITGSTKLATGNKNEGLGTGATDYTVELGAYKTFGGFSLNAGLGYTNVGSNTFVKLKRSVVPYSVGGTYKVDDDWSIGAGFDSGGVGAHSPKVLRAVAGTATREVTEYVTYKISSSWKLELYGIEGMSNASPDSGGGATVTLSF